MNSLSRAIILILAIPVLVGAVAIGTDIAVLHSDLVQAQEAADAAVLAGVRFLPASPDSAIRTAKSCATLHGIRPGEIISTEIGPDHLSITISISRSIPYVFSNIFRLEVGKLGIVATARVNSASPPYRLMITRGDHGKAFESTQDGTDDGSNGVLGGNFTLNHNEKQV